MEQQNCDHGTLRTPRASEPRLRETGEKQDGRNADQGRAGPQLDNYGRTSSISKTISCARRAAFASGYQAQNIGAHDASCVLWLVATLSCARCVRRDHCHTLLHLDTSSDTTFSLVLPNAAYNTIIPPDSLLILSAP